MEQQGPGAGAADDLIVADAGVWREWLARHHEESAGVWLVLAKKGTTQPTRLTYDEALDEALCQGWIDSRMSRRDQATFRLRFTPRRPRGRWSRGNVSRVERLTAEGRMCPAGLREVEMALADGRWDAAYAGMREIEVPPDLAAALEAVPAARAAFGTLSAQNRYAVLFRVTTARRPDTRARRISRLVAMLGRGETPYPRREPPGI